MAYVITQETDPCIAIIKPQGIFEVESNPDIGEHIHSLIAKGGVRRIVFDLSEVTKLDDTGLGIMLKTQKTLQVADGEMVLASISENAQVALNRRQMYRALKVYPDVEAACAYLKSLPAPQPSN